MGVGHLAASFALRARCRHVPLFHLLLAGVLVDVLWGVAILAGVEHARIGAERGSVVPLVLESVPYTHSLVACLIWAALVAAAWGWRRGDATGALALGALVLGHWLLDVVAHVGDVPLLPAGPLLGLGLWRSRAAALVVELGGLAAGLWVYARGTRARDRIGAAAPFVAGALLLGLGAGAFLGPPPTSVVPIAAGNVALVLLVAAIGWSDRHRAIIEPEVTP